MKEKKVTAPAIDTGIDAKDRAKIANGLSKLLADNYTLYVSNQNPHVERLLMCAFVLGIPEHKMRVVAPDVGGGFGSKIFLYGEETAIVFASKLLKRPIKWTSSRSEAFLSDAHGRDHATTVSLGLDKDGKFLALQVHTTANLGAYLSTFASSVPTILYATLLAGQPAGYGLIHHQCQILRPIRELAVQRGQPLAVCSLYPAPLQPLNDGKRARQRIIIIMINMGSNGYRVTIRIRFVTLH